MSKKKHWRRDRILHAVQERGSVSVGALAEMLDVSMQTVRRDLDAICDAESLRRVHGRIELAQEHLNTPFDQRAGTNPVGKLAIAQAVLPHIPDGATIFLSIGSTTLRVAEALRERRELTVITNNLSAAMTLSDDVSKRIILPGGELRLPDRDFVGQDVVDFFGHYRAEVAIFGTAGVDEAGSLLEFQYAEVQAAEQMRRNSQSAILVIDHSKFGRRAPAAGANIADLDLIICDRRPAPPYHMFADTLGDRIVFAEETL